MERDSVFIMGVSDGAMTVAINGAEEIRTYQREVIVDAVDHLFHGGAATRESLWEACDIPEEQREFYWYLPVIATQLANDLQT